MKSMKNKKLVIWIASVAVVLALTVGGCGLYVSDYYRADISAIEAFGAGDCVTKTEISDGVIAYGESDAKVGMIFYPGGKVEYTAYEPLMRLLASDGVLCILIKMPFNLAVLDVNAAEGVKELYPDIERWYMGGHSLGGSMAASYAAEHTEDFSGVILLGSYSTADLSETSLKVLSVFGSEDQVMNREKYDQYKKKLPSDMTEVEISGGCHAYFGMYGSQDGDGTPTVSAEAQIRETADCIAEFIFEGGN